jgi:glycerate-2-kinase
MPWPFPADNGSGLPPGARPVCHLLGGETTVTVVGRGRGGRNHELALATLLELHGRPGVSLLAAGTDGVDGGSDAAGAFADPEAWTTAGRLGLDPAAALANNDSHGFFSAAGAQLRTGPTGTNVMDITIFLTE